MNRAWADPCPELHPSIFHYKRAIGAAVAAAAAGKAGPVLAAVDLHGHSTRRGFFLYGCDPCYWRPSAAVSAGIGPPTPGLERLLPGLLARTAPGAFSPAGCRYCRAIRFSTLKSFQRISKAAGPQGIVTSVLQVRSAAE